MNMSKMTFINYESSGFYGTLQSFWRFFFVNLQKKKYKIFLWNFQSIEVNRSLRTRKRRRKNSNKNKQTKIPRSIWESKGHSKKSAICFIHQRVCIKMTKGELTWQTEELQSCGWEDENQDKSSLWWLIKSRMFSRM